ncbi:GvpL/GvpF family gas vesicle protein [Anaerobacillus sp. MEB173]|uniref:GvpL/GvpF family gas vesicle protein n=1 Tax=Anaerobacillus sp. MEB173 TaxID=3383345 RepID=UPI003F8FF5E5
MSTSNVKDEPIYVYALVPTKEKDSIPVFEEQGIDDQNQIFIQEFGEFTAIASKLNAYEYSKERLEQYAQDPSWLQKNATHHHDIISRVHTHCTVFPLKFCTIYSNPAAIQEELNKKEEDISRLFSLFKNRAGWNIKIYCHKKTLINYMKNNNSTLQEMKQKLDSMSPGKQFLMRKKFDLQLEQIVNEEIEVLTNKIKEQLMRNSDYYASKKIWNRQITNKTEDMVSNGVYLITNGDVLQKFQLDLEQIQRDSEEFGFLIECTGPWPPYDFLDV